jgi:hypothetical protein
MTGRTRKRAKFNKKSFQASSVPGSSGYYASGQVSITEGTKRVLNQLRAFGVEEGDAILSTNLKIRLDGLPRGEQKEPDDPGVAVYWQRQGDKTRKIMAIDLYDRVADNLAAIAATLDAMRAIERHGGAQILERAFTGFEALPAPNDWRHVMGFDPAKSVTQAEAKERYLALCKQRHPDHGGSHDAMTQLSWAYDQAKRELR